MGQLVQVAATGVTSIGQRAAAQNDRLLLSDFEFDRLSASLFPATLTDLGPGILATAPVLLTSITEAGKEVATFSPLYMGVVKAVCAVVTTAASTAAKLASVGVYIAGPNGVSEVDTLTITGGPASGNFTVAVGGVTSGTVAFNATGATLQTALEAMTNIAVGDVTVTGGIGGPYVLTWAKAFAFQPITLTLANTFNTGTITAVKTTAGVASSPGVNTAINGGVVNLTSANCTPAGAIVPGTNILPSSFGSPSPNTFVSGSTIYLRTVGTPTAFIEGAVSFLLIVEAMISKSQPIGSGAKSNFP